jgi:lambda repressor-like predicted transcriptional regulator
MSNDFNIKVSVRNARLLKLVREKFGSNAEMVRRTGIDPSRLSSYMTMKRSPLDRWGQIRPDVELICAALGANPEDIWPGRLLTETLKTSSAETEVAMDEVAGFIAAPEKTAAYQGLIEKLASAKTVKPRCARAALMYAKGATFREIGRDLGVTQERARQIILRGQREMAGAARRLGVESMDDVA